MSDNTETTVWKQKQDWMKAVMASNLTPAAKVFAYGVFQHMYGDKLVSNPGSKAMTEVTGLAKSKFSEYRKALFEASAMTGQLVESEHGDYDGYEYTLNLDWDGEAKKKPRKTTVKGCTPEGGTSQKDTGSTPEGDTGVPQKGAGVYPTGRTNTSSQDTNEDSKEETKTAAPVEVQEDDQSSLDPSLSTFEEIINPLHSWGVDILTSFIDSHGDMPSPLVETTSSPLVEDSAERAESSGRVWAKKYPEVLELTDEQYVTYMGRRNKRDSHEEAMRKAVYVDVDAW